jgi:hypothetical protein
LLDYLAFLLWKIMMDWSIGEEFRIISTTSSVSLHVNSYFQMKDNFINHLILRMKRTIKRSLKSSFVYLILTDLNYSSRIPTLFTMSSCFSTTSFIGFYVQKKYSSRIMTPLKWYMFFRVWITREWKNRSSSGSLYGIEETSVHTFMQVL